MFAVVSDPVGSGFVKKLSRPGGNVTESTDINIEPSLGGKWVVLVKETSPAIRRVAMLYNPATAPFAAYFLQPFEAAGPELTVQTSAVPINSDTDIEGAMTALASLPVGAFIVLPDAFAINHRNRIVELAARHRLPRLVGKELGRDGLDPPFTEPVPRAKIAKVRGHSTSID